jgi:hypothetical protein
MKFKEQTMNSNELASIVAESNGRFVSVTFIKKDGTERSMLCRLGVTKHLKGGESKLNADQYLTVFDVQKEAYRAINRDTIVSVKLAGATHTATQPQEAA